MMNHLDAARVLLTRYGAALRELRTGHGLSMSEVAVITGVQAPYLSRIEHGRYCPTVSEAEQIAAFANDTTTGAAPLIIGSPTTASHARMSDPVSSDITVKSIAADNTLADKILACARDFQRDGVHIPFDDTDLVEALQDRWPRPVGKPWQRNVVARARGRIGTGWVGGYLHGADTVEWTDRFARVSLPDSPLQRHGLVARSRDGHTRQTVHYVWTGGDAGSSARKDAT